MELVKIQIGTVYKNCMKNYADANNYIVEYKETITPRLICMTTRRRLFKEILDQLGKLYKFCSIDIKNFIKLKTLHLHQLKKLNSKSYSRNKLFLIQIENLFNRCL